MENLWKLIEAAAEHGDSELHHLAGLAKSEWQELKDKIEGLEKEGDGYVPQEYPKMLSSGETVWNAAEEAKATGNVTEPVSVVPEPEIVAVPAVAVGGETAPEVATDAEVIAPVEETAP